MKKDDLFEVLGELDDVLVTEAAAPVRNRPVWRVWGAVAACLCFVAVGAFAASWLFGGRNSIPTGGETGVYSVAVFPPGEKEADVKSAQVSVLTENEMAAQPLAGYLPQELPESFHYGRGTHYETVMKNGAHYHKLQVEYYNGIVAAPTTEDGAAMQDPELEGEYFSVVILNHLPGGDVKIYKPEELAAALFKDGKTVFIQCGSVYIGVNAEIASPETALQVLQSLR